MGYEYEAYMAEEGMAEVIGALVGALSSNVISFALTVATYVLTSLGLYTIAQRRGIKNAWMAWIPVLNMWILGSIADQYRYVARGEVRSRRKVLVVLSALQSVAWIVVMVMLIVMVVNLVMQIPSIEMMSEDQLLDLVLGNLLPLLGAMLLMGVVALAAAIFRYIAYADLFASCEPDNKVLYLVLSILFSVTLPFFVFACRKKDLGMPPRKAQPAAPTQPPVTQIPVMDEPEEPWLKTEE